MADCSLIPVGEFVVAEERRVEQRYVHRRQDLLNRRAPPLPAVRVRHIQQAAVGAFDSPPDVFAVLVPVRNQERGCLQLRAEEDRLIDRGELDVSRGYQLVPGAVRLEECRHTRRCPDGNACSVHRFSAEEHETRVVPDVGVCEQDPGQLDAARLDVGDVTREIRPGVEQPRPVAVDGRNACR